MDQRHERMSQLENYKDVKYPQEKIASGIVRERQLKIR